MAETSAEKLQLLIEQIDYALARDDYETAYKLCVRLQLRYKTTPNQSKDGLEITWQDIETLMRRIEALRRGGAIVRFPVSYARPDDEDTCYR